MAQLDLPTFGIRDLNGPTSPPGLVQITASQYDSTIHSQPDAVLSYIDLDDGELITVGSSFELQQRLEEPVPPSASPFPSLVLDLAPARAARDAKENRLVHIFDIRHTSGSLAVWRDHEAYTRKKLQDRESSSPSRSSTRVLSPHKTSSSGSEATCTLGNSFDQDTLDRSSTTPRQSAQVSDTTTSKESNTGHKSAAQPFVPRESETSIQMGDSPANTLARLESHLGPLADFLESTAEGLRKLAETTAEAGPSPVENVLRGFKNILKEAGEFGLDLLATVVDQELEKNRGNGVGVANGATSHSEVRPSSCLSSTAEKPRAEDKLESDIDPPEKRVSFGEATPTEPLCTKLNPVLPGPLNRDSSSSVAQMSSLPSSALPTSTQQPPGSPYSPSKFIFTHVPAPYTNGRPVQSDGNSIIDSQPSDTDVLTRYPPLPSLRKAISVSGLHSRPGPSSSYQHGLSTTSALSRYPSIGQFEEQSRASPRVDLDSKPSYDRWRSLVWPPVPRVSKKTDIYKKPTVDDEDEATAALQTDLADKIKVPGTQAQAAPKWPSVLLPGAWPEPKPEQQTEPKREDRTNEESNYTADIGKMSKNIPMWTLGGGRGSFTGGLSQQTTRPDGTYSRGPIFPRKSQTVSGTNPAARLSGPFDPLAQIPVLQPRPQRSQPDLSASKVGFLKTTLNPALPDPLPQRSQTLHHTDRYKPRDTAPYQNPRYNSWNKYLRNHRGTITDSSVPYYPFQKQFFDQLESGSPPSTTFNHPPRLTTRPPIVPAQRPTRPLDRTQPIANQSMHSPSAGSPPSAPQLLRASSPEIIRVGPPTVNGTSLPSPPFLPAPPPAAVLVPPAPAPGTVSRSSSILSPCPPAFTRPRGRSGLSPPAPFSSKSVDECVKSLRAMGFGRDNPNELARLNVYAGAAAGDVELAIELIEEDREAAKELGKAEHIEIKDLGKESDVEENPWED